MCAPSYVRRATGRGRLRTAGLRIASLRTARLGRRLGAWRGASVRGRAALPEDPLEERERVVRLRLD